MTKVNTILKSSILLLAILAIAFMFTACGNKNNKSQFTEVKVDTNATYVDSTLGEVQQIIADSTPETPSESETFIYGYHLSMSMIVKTASQDEITSNYNIFYKKTTDETGTKIEIALKVTNDFNNITSTFYYIINEPTDSESTADFYANISNIGKFKMDMNTILGQSSIMTCEITTDLIEALQPKTDNELMIDDNQFAIANEETTTKIRIIIPGATEEDNATIYYILKDGNFNSMKVENLIQDNGPIGSNTISLALTNWAGNIDYPNFKDYKTYVESIE